MLPRCRACVAAASLAAVAGRGSAQDHPPPWSFAPLVPVDVPAVAPERAGWVRNPVDAFVLAELAEQGLEPAPEADRRTLLRRLSFDLTGLPPTPEELAVFLADDAPDAYERVVERLLASPRHGERWAQHWLDVAHYADTHGYDKDKRRPYAWPYRDWVIGALNDDMPWGRFVAMQLAGDVLDPGDPDGVVATGFVAAGPWDYVGHVELREGTLDKAIARNLDRDDMVRTALGAFTSLTVHCARCHDHKFDPITQRDYYGLQAAFAGVERAERAFDRDPAVTARRGELTGRVADLEERRAELRARVLAPAAEGTLGYHSAIEAAPDVTKWVQVDLGAPLALEAVALVPSHVVYGGHPGPGFGFAPALRVEASDDPEFAAGVVLLGERGPDLPNPGDVPWVIEPAHPVSARHVRVSATRLWERTDDFALALAELVVVSSGADVALGRPVTALDSIEAGGSWGAAHLVDGVLGHADLAQLAARLSLGDAATRAELAEIEDELAEARAELEALPEPERVYAAAASFAPEGNFTPPPDGRPRPVHLLRRGSERDPAEPTPPGAVAAVPGPDPRFALADGDDEGARRLALARWITDRANPLTWRSIANRLWQHHLGRGIVGTPNDFGHMGSEPTHPELLDWLAVRLRDGDQSLKDLHRLIVTSATYRQSSAGRPAAQAVDAGNRWLWRANRRRLDAEELRDAMLQVSGELDLTMGGPGFDRFVFEDDHSPRYLYEEHDPDDPRALRRSIYRFVVRSVPDPFLTRFDGADPSASVPARGETTTALQALTLLNDRDVLRRAERFAERVERLAPDTDGRVEAAWRLALGRAPDGGERALARAHVERHGLPALCRALFNTAEFVYVD